MGEFVFSWATWTSFHNDEYGGTKQYFSVAFHFNQDHTKFNWIQFNSLSIILIFLLTKWSLNVAKAHSFPLQTIIICYRNIHSLFIAWHTSSYHDYANAVCKYQMQKFRSFPYWIIHYAKYIYTFFMGEWILMDFLLFPSCLRVVSRYTFNFPSTLFL